MRLRKTVIKKESKKRTLESMDKNDFQVDLRNEFLRLGSFLRSLLNDGIHLNGLEIEVDCHLGMDDEDNIGFNISCMDMANESPNLPSEVDVFLDEMGDYIEDSVPNCKSQYNKYHVPDYADAVSVDVTCVVQPVSGTSLHDIIDVFEYNIVFPYIEDMEAFDLEVMDSGFKTRLRDTKDNIYRMISLH